MGCGEILPKEVLEYLESVKHTFPKVYVKKDKK